MEAAFNFKALEVKIVKPTMIHSWDSIEWDKHNEKAVIELQDAIARFQNELGLLPGPGDKFDIPHSNEVYTVVRRQFIQEEALKVTILFERQIASDK